MSYRTISVAQTNEPFRDLDEVGVMDTSVDHAMGVADACIPILAVIAHSVTQVGTVPGAFRPFGIGAFTNFSF